MLILWVSTLLYWVIISPVGIEKPKVLMATRNEKSLDVLKCLDSNTEADTKNKLPLLYGPGFVICICIIVIFFP